MINPLVPGVCQKTVRTHLAAWRPLPQRSGMRIAIAPIAPLALALMVAACARQAGQPAAPRDGVLTGEQLLKSGTTNIYDAIQKLRPQCLRMRTSAGLPVTRNAADPGDISGPMGVAHAREIALYIDGSRSGRAEDLRSIGVAEVVTIECLSAIDAAQRFGLNNSGGAIVVTRRRG